MKKTKTIEVEICDQCGAEISDRWHLQTCSSCKKEMCANCTARMSVRIQVTTPRPYDTYGGEPRFAHSVMERRVALHTVYCTACGNDIERKLLEAGFVSSPVEAERRTAVMD